MSEDFLSRWSRRKRGAVQETKDAGPAEAERAPQPEALPALAKAPTTAAKPEEPAFDIASLPPIESITAATDIRPFLAPGIPADLARAALRRAWSADPAIRNFVGLADYAWDYHTPGSMPGFGPLEMTDELRQAVARIVGGMPEADSSAIPEAISSDGKSAEKPNDINRGSTFAPAISSDSNSAPEQVVGAQRQDVASNPERHLATEGTQPVVPQESEQHEDTPSIVRRTHGGALPK